MDTTPGRRKFSDPRLNSRFLNRKGKGPGSNVYYVSHFGTPRRSTKLKPPAIHKVTSVTNLSCTSSRVHAPPENLKCSRSLSLQDLSPGIQTRLSRRRALICSRGNELQSEMSGKIECLSERSKTLAYKVYGRWLRNAWKNKCEESMVKEISLKSAGGQITHLKLQMSSLKTILKSDEQIISGSFREISNLKAVMVKLQEQYDLSKKERDEAQAALSKVEKELHDIRTESLNDKNSLMLAKSEAAALEAQLEKEREKIAKLKTENGSLHDKVEKYSKNSKGKSEKICRLSENVDCLEKQISSCTQLLRTSQVKIDELQRALGDATECIRNQKKELGEAISREGNLRTQLDEATAMIREQAHQYNKTVKEKTMELIRLETELAMKEEDPLKIQVVKLVTSALNYPLVFISALNNQQWSCK